MANWCNNFLKVEGKDAKRLLNIFEGLARREEKTNKGQSLKCFNDDRYMFDIYTYSTDDDYRVSFQTKWSPATNSILKLFTKYDVEGYYDYSEEGSNVLGKITKENGIITESVVSHDEFDKIDHSENLDMYIFEGEHYENLSDIYEILLDRI